MEQQPLVSVIINCYNGEKYLREAIDSVVAQTYTNWEIIFWDNQSTDGTRAIVESYNNPKIHYIYAPTHTPLGEARNLAVEKANGEYINFLDADDIWSPNKLEEQIKLIEPGKCEVVFTPFKIKVMDEGNVNKTMLAMFNSIKDYRPKHRNLYPELLEQNRIVFSSVLFNRDLYLSVGGVDCRFQQNEDYHILLKCALKTEFAMTESVGCTYRIHGVNNSNKIWSLGYFENRIIFSELPVSSSLSEAIKRNETRIAFYTMTYDKNIMGGAKLLFTKGSLWMLLIMFIKKIIRNAFNR